MTSDARVLLIILDGFGEAPDRSDNAVTRAHMAFMEGLKKRHPWTRLNASGNAVGLPKGVQGNSEVGHFTIGSGRITFQSLEAINRSIQSRDFFKLSCLVQACQLKPKKALHLLGMISDEGVHSHTDHLFALLELAKQQRAFPIYIHGILDGRDVPERSAPKYLRALQKKIHALGLDQPLFKDGPPKASIATLIGRYYAMDRDHNWDRTRKAYELLVHGKGTSETNPLKAIENAYKAGAETDYYVPPILLNEHGTVRKGDSMIFFNFRTDRTRQLTEAFLNKKFGHFKVTPLGLNVVAMGPYTDRAPVAFPSAKIRDNLADTLARHKQRQLHMAETEKYAHVTYFFNSQEEDPKPHEDRIMVDSPKCPSYADQPEMSAAALTDRLIEQLKRPDPYPFVVVNYANPDLVGHSGELRATIKACKTIDQCLKRSVPQAQSAGYSVLITADHGNAEQMRYPNGEPCPSHTTNPVPLILISREKRKLRKGGGLQDVAPTVLDLLGLPKPDLMTGESLLKL